MAFSRLRRQITLATAIFILYGPTAESLVPPLSINQRRHAQFPSVVETMKATPPSSARTSNTLLMAVSLEGTKLPETDDADDGDDSKDMTKLDTTGDDVSKFRQLKDVMWIREALEDWTAAEFALSVEQQAALDDSKKKKRAVDYEKLMTQLTKRIEDMTCQSFVDYTPLVDDEGVLKLDANLGMGRYAYTSDERMDLMEKILKTRVNLQQVIQKNESENSDSEDDEPTSLLDKVKVPEFMNLLATSEGEEGNSTSVASGGPKLYVRDDGTVDWEGALQDRAALKQFGGAVWARINGQTPDDLGDEDDETAAVAGGGHGESKPAVTAKIEDTPAIQEARKKLNQVKDELKQKEKAHTALVESGISAGQATANVKLASVNPALRNEIRQSAEGLQVLEQRISYQNLVYELERIYTYLITELENPTTKGYIPLQDRLNVAEYGLLESQVESCSRELNSKGVLDADILAVIAEQMIDFKRRLGIDYYVAGLTYDREAITRWLNDLYVSSKVGIMFYVKGCRLFWNDILYCASLIGRAVQGVTLKPREVRTIRRTFKDVITFIPVVIILIIPLSPVGHVLVFGAIQRFFPDFFPSCFTEQRQNLLQLYETTEFSEVTIKENLQERLNRFLEALAFFIVNKSRNLYQKLTNTYSESDETADETPPKKVEP